jgi:hypothetical protein
MKVFAIITLAQPLSRAGSDRWGPFLRSPGEKEHLWMGRKLTPEEFNAEFPKALRFAGPDRPLVGRILVESEVAGEGDSCHNMPLAEHEAKIAEIQSGVDAWVAEQNQKLLDAAARIEQLESLLAQRPGAAVDIPTDEATPPKVEETIPGAPEGASEGSDSVSAGAQTPNQPDSPPDVVVDDVDPVEAPKAAPAPAKKAKGAAKAK